MVCIDFTTTDVGDGDNAAVGRSNVVDIRNVVGLFDREESRNPLVLTDTIFLLIDAAADVEQRDPGGNNRFSGRVYSVPSSTFNGNMTGPGNETNPDIASTICPARFDGTCSSSPCRNGVTVDDRVTSSFFLSRCDNADDVCREGEYSLYLEQLGTSRH